jgi:hypothetical protein
MPIKFLRRLLSKVMMLTSSSEPSSTDWRQRLAIRERRTISNAEFSALDRLHRGFSLADIDDNGNIDVASFESRDLSCHWDRYAIPSDIRHRLGGRQSDGCYSITVETARFRELATPCHDPIEQLAYENYAHVEIRWLNPGESVEFTPPHGRKNRSGKSAKADRLAWRSNAVRHLRIELDASG